MKSTFWFWSAVVCAAVLLPREFPVAQYPAMPALWAGGLIVLLGRYALRLPARHQVTDAVAARLSWPRRYVIVAGLAFMASPMIGPLGVLPAALPLTLIVLALPAAVVHMVFGRRA